MYLLWQPYKNRGLPSGMCCPACPFSTPDFLIKVEQERVHVSLQPSRIGLPKCTCDDRMLRLRLQSPPDKIAEQKLRRRHAMTGPLRCSQKTIFNGMYVAELRLRRTLQKPFLHQCNVRCCGLLGMESKSFMCTRCRSDLFCAHQISRSRIGTLLLLKFILHEKGSS